VRFVTTRQFPGLTLRLLKAETRQGGQRSPRPSLRPPWHFVMFDRAPVPFRAGRNDRKLRQGGRSNAVGLASTWAAPCKRSGNLHSDRDRRDLPVCSHTQDCSGYYIFSVAPCISPPSDVPRQRFVRHSRDVPSPTELRTPASRQRPFANKFYDLVLLAWPYRHGTAVHPAAEMTGWAPFLSSQTVLQLFRLTYWTRVQRTGRPLGEP